VEEILWRGFLIWYCDQYLPLWTAALLVTLAFALAHAYQGLAQLPAIVLVGGAFAGLYLLTGSIWLPIVLHAAIDILQGRMVYEVLRRCDSGDEGINGTSALPAT
jgi:membrane protease YdiL (CAAX protease family)